MKQKQLLLLLAFVISISSAMAQTTVTGTVTDDYDMPIPGVTVMVKGTSVGTATDVDGKYTLSIPESAETLVVSFIGMKTLELPITGTQINVQMEADVMELEELVVVGYGTMKKSDLTGAVTRMSMDDLPPQANLNIVQALQGYSPGVNVQATGGAGSEPNLSVRGQTSLSASDQPLIVLNGIIYNGSISDININDVETVDILKDASAAAVYGSRSANGVLIITTKKGKTDKPKITFNAYYGVQDMTNNPMRVMNGEEYALRLVDYYYQQDLYQWYYTNPTSDAGKPAYPNISDRTVVASRLRTQEEKDNYVAGNEINWVDEATQVAPIQQYNLSVAGQSNSTSYYVSGSYTNEEGIRLNDQFSRLTFQSNIESKLSEWLTVSAISSYSYRDYSGMPADLNDARRVSPLADNKIGPNFDTYLTGELYMPYPMADLYVDNSDIRNNFNLVGKATVTIPWIKGLSYNIDVSNNYLNRNNNSFFPVSTPNGAGSIGRAEKNPSEVRNLLFNNIISYNNSFGDHSVSGTLLYSRENRFSQSSELYATQFDNPILGYNSMELGTTQWVNSDAWEEKSLAYMGRLNYTFKDRYLLTGTVRKDGYSGFGADNKFATFPSVSLGWIISDEAFFSPDDVYLKLRTSYGINGNQGIGRYSSLSRMSTQS
ncbi:MAG: SusC/RagA family TonB-linked outer membrane protein, partial [Cyclobacteriaceae bacterium]|nr:SusC/RagA family TonB-linked outer membrane protein [Cyclobacteriaceae bacterium]